VLLSLIQSRGSSRLGASFPGNGKKESTFKTSCFFKKKSQNMKTVSVTLVVLCSNLWISRHVKMELIGCPEMSIRNYLCTPHNITCVHHIIYKKSTELT
jgi:hypothetical protein